MECYDLFMAVVEIAQHATEVFPFGDFLIIEWDTGVTNTWRWMPDIDALCYVEGSDA